MKNVLKFQSIAKTSTMSINSKEFEQNESKTNNDYNNSTNNINNNSNHINSFYQFDSSNDKQYECLKLYLESING